MDSDDFRLWCIIVAMVATICALIIGGSWVSGWRDENGARHIENMARLGYEEAPVPGSDMKVWRKAGGNFEMQGSGPRHFGETQKGEKRK